MVARPGQTVLQVAREQGAYVPSLCYHPRVGQAGLCRVCVAEVVGTNGLQTTCTLPVRDGMEVRT
ncbi:MAG: 2Fe-2S iron-sulfur cluster-binding protein, partial [Chloroflexota bacterium]|nr:2Fe-2S iron-sulfur cluster-binding protein [Chloroflexota bacterium]